MNPHFENLNLYPQVSKLIEINNIFMIETLSLQMKLKKVSLSSCSDFMGVNNLIIYMAQ